jgi:hypothetical protein
MATAEAMGLSAEPLSGIVHMALGRVLTRQGRLAQAQEQLEWSLELFAIDSMALYRAQALLLLAAVRHGRDDLAGARHLLEHAHALIDQLADPGGLPSLLQQSRRTQATSHRRAQVAAPLTQRELAVLRLLPARCRPGRSGTSSMCRSTPSVARSRPSTASWTWQAGPRRSPRRAGLASCPGRALSTMTQLT